MDQRIGSQGRQSYLTTVRPCWLLTTDLVLIEIELE